MRPSSLTPSLLLRRLRDTGILSALLLSLTPAKASAQQAFSVGVTYNARVQAPASDTVRHDSPLIGAPSWWPKRITHQNFAALAIAGVAGITFLYLLPEELSDWDKSVPMGRHVRYAFTRAPIWDDDPYYWNYIIHPVTGSWVYLMERNHARSAMRGFLLSTAASVGWEYGFETIMQQPSIQDLLVTSTVGSLLGELSYKATLAMKKNGFNAAECVIVTLINPHYVVSRGYR